MGNLSFENSFNIRFRNKALSCSNDKKSFWSLVYSISLRQILSLITYFYKQLKVKQNLSQTIYNKRQSREKLI